MKTSAVATLLASFCQQRRRLLRTAAALFLAAALPAAAAALAIDPAAGRIALSPHLGILEDPRGEWSIADIERLAALPANRFVPAGGGEALNLGYSHSVWWFRLELNAPVALQRTLEIDYPPLDDVQLFVADRNGGYRVLRSGDLLPFADRPLANRAHAFPLDLAAGDNVLYLRVRSAGTLTVPVVLWEPQAFVAHLAASYTGYALYFGILLALGGYNLLLYLSLRERVYLDYILFLAAMALGIGTLNGLTGQFVWPAATAWGNLALPLGMALSGLLAARFVRSFLDTPRNAPRLDRTLLFFVAWFAGAMALTAVSYQWAEQATSFGSILFCITAWAAGWLRLRQGYAGARFFLLAWTALLIGSSLLAARNFGWVPTNALTSNGFQVGSALEMLLLSFALADRINVLRRDNERSAQALLAAKEEMVAALRRSEAALEARVDERTAALAEANRQLELLSRRDPLTGLGNRNELERAWTEMPARAGGHYRGVVLLLLDLDGFKPINDRYGHEAGDRVLREVAERLRGATRHADAVVRLGGDEFVVLADDMARDEGLDTFVAKIRDTFARPFAVDGRTLPVGVSIGCAHYPSECADLQALLQRADQAMYDDKARGRGAPATASSPQPA